MTINKTSYGVILGLALPMLTALALHKYVYSGQTSFVEFLQTLAKFDQASTLLAVCAISNLACFMIFANINKLFIARGIFLATILYALAVLILKFVVQ